MLNSGNRLLSEARNFGGLGAAALQRMAHFKAQLALIAVTLLFIGCACMVNVQNAYADEATIDGVTYTYSDAQYAEVKGIVISDMKSSSSSARVPEKINGAPVVRITIAEKNLGSIKALDVSQCSSLQGLWCHTTGLTSLNVSGCNALEYLRCESNSLTSLNVSNLTSLKNLYCNNNKLTSLNIAGCSLDWLECQNNDLSSLSLAGLSSLGVLFCENNRIKDTSALEAWAKDRPQSIVLPQKADSSRTGKWLHGSKGWWYKYSDSSYAKGWLTIDKVTYYLDNNGWMKTGWQKIDNNWYYFKGSGARATDWQKVGGKWYYLDGQGVMQTGKQSISGKTYFLAESGAMKTGWVKQGNNWYYCNKSGAMKTGWQKISGKWYYLNPADGKMLTGKQTIGGKAYFLTGSGAMKTGWNKESGKWFYYDGSGAMKTNAWISGKYWVGSDGVMATYSWVDNGRYYVDGNGKWVKNTKYQSGNQYHCITGPSHSPVKVGMNGEYTRVKCSVCGEEFGILL